MSQLENQKVFMKEFKVTLNKLRRETDKKMEDALVDIQEFIGKSVLSISTGGIALYFTIYATGSQNFIDSSLAVITVRFFFSCILLVFLNNYLNQTRLKWDREELSKMFNKKQDSIDQFILHGQEKDYVYLIGVLSSGSEASHSKVLLFIVRSLNVLIVFLNLSGILLAMSLIK